MLVLMSSLLAGLPAGAVTPGDCHRHREEFVASLEENRRNSVREIEQARRETDDPGRRERLEQERNEAWEFEERMRATGDQIFRDCMAHVEGRKAGG